MSKNDKTSKTARVMNLLSKKTDAAAPVQEPIVTSMAPDAAVSVQIKNALEDALEGELAPQQPVPQPEPKPQPSLESEPQPESAPTAPAGEPPVPAAPEEPARQFLEPENPGDLNVMQVLVEEKAPKYVQMFGLCTCKRCMEDVKAYTLNHLPPKYVVLEPNDRVPRLTVYEGKFSSDITAQLLQACKAVHETPHHSRA